MLKGHRVEIHSSGYYASIMLALLPQISLAQVVSMLSGEKTNVAIDCFNALSSVVSKCSQVLWFNNEFNPLISRLIS